MVLALDLGGTHIRIAEVSGGKIFNKEIFDTPKKRKEILGLLFSIIGDRKFSKICVASAGVEIEGKIKNVPNIDLENFELRKILRAKFRTPVFLDNDARCACAAEMHFGNGRQYNNFVFLTLGTGIGGAIVFNKKIYRGSGAAGEICNMNLDGKNFEQIASGKAAHKLGRSKVGENLGKGLASLSYILAPEAFILGGGFADVKEIYHPMKETLKKKYFLRPIPHIMKAKFGDDAGLIGAAMLG